MNPFRRPLIALSLTEPDFGLLRYAREVIRLGACEEIRFVHVIEGPLDPSAAEREQARTRMTEEVSTHAGALDTATEFEVRHGARLDQLLAAAARNRHDLMILGHRKGRSGHRSLARRLAMMAPCSVWLVPEGSPPRISSILVPIDFSAPSADALSTATAIAARRSIDRCTAAHFFEDPSTIRYSEHLEEVRGRERAAFDAFLARVDRHDVTVEPVFEESTHPPQAIVRIAQKLDADLIVMNTRGRSRAAAVLLGSITSKTMEETRIPLLAVKHFGGPMSVLEAVLHPRYWEATSLKTN